MACCMSVGVFIQVSSVPVRSDADILNCTLGFGGVGAEVREVVANRNVIKMRKNFNALAMHSHELRQASPPNLCTALERLPATET